MSIWLLLLYGTFYKRCTRVGSRGLLSYSRDSNNAHTHKPNFIRDLPPSYSLSIFYILYSCVPVVFTAQNAFVQRSTYNLFSKTKLFSLAKSEYRQRSRERESVSSFMLKEFLCNFSMNLLFHNSSKAILCAAFQFVRKQCFIIDQFSTNMYISLYT